MTAAGVQNIDSAAYLPPPPSTSTSTPDAKAAGAAGKQSLDQQGKPSDFQNELEQQDAGSQDAQSAGLPKADSGKARKKRETRPEESNLTAATPVQVAEPQQQIPALALALPQPQENAKPDGNAKLAVTATPAENAKDSGSPQEPVLQDGPALPAIAIGPRLTQPGQPAALRPSAKLRQFPTPVEAPPIPGATAATSATPDPSKASPLVSGLPLAPQLVVPDAATKSKDSLSQELDPNQTLTSAKPGASSTNQPVSRIEPNLPAVPAEPVATAVQQTVDSTPSSPSALAFAARMAAAPQKADGPVAANPSQPPAIPDSQTSAQIPVRYAATAQIIPSAGAGTKEDGSKKDAAAAWKDAAAAFDQAVRADAQTNIRTDMVIARPETASQASPAPAPAAPQQATPSAQMDRIIEPPAAPPTSNHDIRVRVPDNNGGSTQVRFVESGGEVRVSVRTADEGLAQNLRTHLNDLTQRLSDGGMPAEIWKPAPNTTSSQNDQQQPNRDGRGSSGQGSSSGQGEQQDRQQNRPAWLQEMEASLHSEQN